MQLNFIMPTFALQKIEAIKGKQEFEKLVVDGKCPFDEFEKGLEERDRKEMVGIYNSMQAIADLRSLPYKKFHFYDEGENGVREFEFKSKNLRVYGITKKNGKIVIYGGTKANQVHDSAEFRRIKNLFLSSLT